MISLNKDRAGFYHEILDRLSCMCNIFEANIIEHDSDDILPEYEKLAIQKVIYDAYQLVGERICNFEENVDNIH